MSCPRRLSLAALLAVVLAGCGDGPAARHPRAAKPACSAAVRAAVAQAAGETSGRSRVTASFPGQTTCLYAAGGLRVDVLVDSNPQALFRFNRQVVEWGQVALWSHHHEHLPLQLQGLGELADWFPADRVLLSTDGRRLISVTLVRAPPRPRAQLRLGRTLTQLTLARAR